MFNPWANPRFALESRQTSDPNKDSLDTPSPNHNPKLILAHPQGRGDEAADFTLLTLILRRVILSRGLIGEFNNLIIICFIITLKFPDILQ